MKCTNPIILRMKNELVYPYGLEVACGKCIECRINRKNEWIIRLLHEYAYHDKALFITLTYSDDHLPYNCSLQKSDIQKFLKRLRKNYQAQIKYFIVGEYGPNTNRPHYHGVIFGLDMEDAQKVVSCWQLCDWMVSTIYKRSFGTVTIASIQYILGYVIDKLSGTMAEDNYDALGIERPFALMSKGLGRKYSDDNIDRIKKQMCITLDGVKHSVPRYYVKRHNIDCNNQEDSNVKIIERSTGLSDVCEDDLFDCADSNAIDLYYREKIRLKKQNNLNHTTMINLRAKNKKI